MTSASPETPQTEPTETGDPLLGRVLAGKYRIEARVGAGSMGAVYRATHVTLERTLAVKVMLPTFSADATFHARFLREARAASRLDHPHSVAIVDFGTEESDGTAYLVMEYLDGRSLFDLLCDEGTLEIPRALRIVTQVLSALAMAHDSGVVHRDLKPENIMLVSRLSEDGDVDEHAKVADFGIASLADARGRRSTMNGRISGTPEYMSPEQGRGGAIDGRSDLYACGVLLYQLVTGTLPFEDRSAVGVLLMQLNERPVPPSQRFAGVPAALDAVIMRALEKAPAARFPDARAMRAALHALLDDHDAPRSVTRGRTTMLLPTTVLPEKITKLPRAPMPDIMTTRTLAGASEPPPPLAPSNRSPRRPTTNAPRVLDVRGLEPRSHRVRNGLALLAAVALFGGVSAATLMHDAGTRPLALALALEHPTHAARRAPSPPAVASVAAHASAPAVARAVVAAAERPTPSPAPAGVKPPAAREPSRTEVPRVRHRAPRVGQIAAHVLRASMLSAALAGAPAATGVRAPPSAPRVTLGSR